MKNKKVISLVLAFLILFSNISPALAATFDLYSIQSEADDVKFLDFAYNIDLFYKVFNNVDKYYQKSDNNKYYFVPDIDKAIKSGAKNHFEAIKNLQAYISLEEIGNERINGVLSSNIPQYTEELYTVESWNIFENARKELEQLRSQRFVREDILGEKIQALNIAYKELEEAGPESVLKIRTIVQTPSIVVKVGEVLSLPITIVAEMSDGSHREVEVVWQDIPSTEVSGSFKAIGSAKNIRTTISIIVEEDILVDKTKLVEAIRAGQKVSPNMFSEYSYRELAEALVDGNFVNENPSASPEEVEKAIDRIYRAIGLLVEEKPASRIVHLISPDKLIVEQGQYFEMPKTVIVVMNSGAKVQQEVVWDLILTSENLGTFSVEGTTANTNLKAIFTIEVVEAKKGIDFSGLDLAIQKANEVDRNNKSPESLARLDQALDWAKTIRNSEQPSQEAIDSAKSSLNEAIDALANLLVAPTLIVTEPSRDQNLKAGDLLKIEAKGEVNGKAGFKIALPGSVNRTIIPQNMTETSPGVYTGEFVVPEGFNGTDLEVFVSLTGENGKTAFAEASGKINITQELTVRYTGLDQGDVIETVARATNPKKIPESSKEGFFIEWTLNDSIIDPRSVEVHENLIFKANYKEIPDAWANLKFELPKGINFENGEKTEFRILKSKSLAEQGVSVPKVDSNTLPVGQKIVWDFDGGVLISTDTTLVARLEKDSDQYETYTVLVGENGKLIDEGKNSFEILKANASEENLREKATKFVKADINYVISDININSTNITVNFAEESGKWVDVVFIDDKGIEIENGNYHVTIDQSFNDAGVVAPKLVVPKGQKIDWKIGELAYIPEATINYQAEPIKIQAQFVRDDDQYKNITVKVTNPIDNLNKWEDKSFEVFVDDSENTIVEKAKAFVPGDGDYITDTAVYEYDTETVNITLKKNPEKWIDVTFVSGEFGKLYSPTTQVTNEPITVNVIKGKTLEKILSSKGIEVRAEDGYKFENWKIENQIVDLKTEIVTNSKIQADFKIDEEIWATVSFELGENGIFEDGAKTSQKVLKTTKWSEIEVPAPKANVGYRFKGWTPELPKDNEFVETKTYTANFEFIVDEYIYRYIQVDENGGIVKDAYDRDFEVYPQAKYTGTTYKDYPNHTQPEIPNGMKIYGEVEKTEISSETGAKITKETRYYKATPEKIRELQNNLADDVEKKINIVKVQGNDMSFSFDKQKRTIYLEILNPDAETMGTLITALTGSGIFSAITSVEGAQIAKFGNEKIRLVDEKGNPRTESEIKSDMTSRVIMSEIFASFGLNEKNMQAHLDSLYRWHGNLSAVDLSGKGKNPEIFYSDRYTFEFKITDREVVFDADNKGSFVDEAKITKKLPYGKAIGQENIPKFNANDGFELKGFLASYDEYIISKDEQGNETGKVENKVDIPVSIDGLKDLIVRSKLVIKPQVEEVTKTYTVEIDGKNGSFLNPEKKTVTLNSLAAEEEVKKQALNLVKADQGYIIGDVIVENARNIVKVSFVEDTAQWATVIFDGNDFINTKELKILKNSTINENYSDIELKAEYKTITVKGWKLEGDSTNKIYSEEEIKNYKVENNTKFSLMLERKVDQIVYFDSNSSQFEKVDVSNENIILQNEGKIFKLSGDVAKKYLPNKYELVDESDYYEAKMGSDGTNFNVVVSVKEKSSDASLQMIKVNDGDLEGFGAEILEYNITLPLGTTEVPNGRRSC